jgi:hypothetical protein
MLKLKKYIEIQKQKNEKKKKCYKNILKNINKLIEEKILDNTNYLIFELFPIIIGEADYNMFECTEYLIENLNKEKIMEDVSFYEPNVLYIKWDINKIIN